MQLKWSKSASAAIALLAFVCAQVPLHASPANDTATETNGNVASFRGVNGYIYEIDPSTVEAGRYLPIDFPFAVFFGSDFSKRLIGLHTTRISDPTEPVRFTLDQTDAGFRYTQTRAIDAGFAPSYTLTSLIGIASPFASVMPILGGKLSRTRFVPSKAAAKELPGFKLPIHAEEFDGWGAGDELSFEAAGGVLASIGIGGNLTAGTEARIVVLGRWIVNIVKEKDRVVTVRVILKRLESATHVVGALTFAMENSALASSDHSHAYRFDLDDRAALQAYRAMLRGDLDLASGLAEDHATAVQRISDAGIDGTGLFNVTRFGLPFAAFISTTRAELNTQNTTELAEEDATVEVNYSIHLNEKKVGGMFLTHRKRTHDFYAARYSVDMKEGSRDGYWGQVAWSYENHKTTRKMWSSALRELIRKSGLDTELKTEIPDQTLGYVRSSFRVMFPDATTDELMQISREEPTAHRFETRASVLLHTYFDAGTDPLDLCDGKELEACHDKQEKALNKALPKVLKELRRMTSLKDGDRQEFAKAYGEFGRLMIKNPFIFKSVLSLVEENPPTLLYEVEGERVNRVIKQFRWSRADTERAFRGTPLETLP